MKKATFLSFLVFAVNMLFSQNYTIDFSGTGESTVIDSVIIQNLNLEISITIKGDDILLLSSTNEVQSFDFSEFEDIQVYPNPSTEQALISFIVNRSGPVMVAVYDLSGKVKAKTKQFLHEGNHFFKIKGLNMGLYIVKVKTGNEIYTAKLISKTQTVEALEIKYNSSLITGQNKNYPQCNNLKSATSTISMPYNEGDRIIFTGISGNKQTIISDIPTGSKNIEFTFFSCTDGDGNHYPIVSIGAQHWMAKNLKATKYIDGTEIELVSDQQGWSNLSIPAYCWYNNDQVSNKNVYGALYNWYTVNTDKLCPDGWHVPSDSEFEILTDFLDDADFAGGKLKQTGTINWNSPNSGATNETGFTALPGGSRDLNGTQLSNGFFGIKTNGYWWSSTEISSEASWYRPLFYNYRDFISFGTHKRVGLSVRCLRD